MAFLPSCGETLPLLGMDLRLYPGDLAGYPGADLLPGAGLPNTVRSRSDLDGGGTGWETGLAEASLPDRFGDRWIGHGALIPAGAAARSLHSVYRNPATAPTEDRDLPGIGAAAALCRPVWMARNGASCGKVYRSIPTEEQSKAVILTGNYGQAGAIDFYGSKLGLPKAISGHQNYYYWGLRGYTGEVVIAMGMRLEVLRKYFEDVVYAGQTYHPYAMAYENTPIYICRNPKVPLQAVWEEFKDWR